MAAKLIVYPPDAQGWRRVRYDGVAIGVAHHPADIRVFLAAAGFEDADDVDLTDPDFVEWGAPDPKHGTRPADGLTESTAAERVGHEAVIKGASRRWSSAPAPAPA
ncbi:hypothetical protein [Streptomyces sp. NPDC058623]|uniref:hypothetical protein n=1 Tax=Streptomyces sp. NPDC058623 TaxID=3346563 RepID=UPI003649F251